MEQLELIARVLSAVAHAVVRFFIRLLGTRTLATVIETGKYETSYRHRGVLIREVYSFVIYEFTARGKRRAFRKQSSGVGTGGEMVVHFLPLWPNVHIFEPTPEHRKAPEASFKPKEFIGQVLLGAIVGLGPGLIHSAVVGDINLSSWNLILLGWSGAGAVAGALLSFRHSLHL